MKQVIDNLRKQEYVSASNVEAIRKYVRVKNPNGSGEELSAVFADALHKIIDTRIYQFEEEHRKKIKKDILRKAVKKKDFSINAAEVFSSCLSLKLYEDNYINSLTQWINQNQPVTVTYEKVDKLVAGTKQLEEEYIENNLEEIIDEFENNWAEDGTLAVLLAAEEQCAAVEAAAQDIEEPNDYQADDEFEIVEAPEISKEKPFVLVRKFAALALDNIKYVKPSMRLALPAMLPLVIITALVLTDMFSDNRIHALQHQDQGRYANITEDQVDRYMSLESRVLKKLHGFSGGKNLVLLDGMHEELNYEEVDTKKLKKWLEKKNSMLAEDPYFAAILAASKNYDIHPLFMFAIVGQEQGFVPKSGTAAKKIANNPFNVYGSWENYNTNIYDSSRLAADTIIKSSRNRPAYINTIKWINRRYAKDPNWWNGVSMLFIQMEKEIADQK